MYFNRFILWHNIDTYCWIQVQIRKLNSLKIKTDITYYKAFFLEKNNFRKRLNYNKH